MPLTALNLASAVEAALACGVLTLVAAALSGSVLAGVGSALLFAGSYTFWSQSIIAEVYALHILAIGLTLGLLLRWEQRPTLARLGAFFAVYAIAFGNHLSMILLAPAYTFFLLASAPRGWRSLVTWPVTALALTAATAGALQYAWNLRTLWFGLYPPDGLLDALRTGWFDITKADWRQTMALQVPSGMAGDHAAMYRFDLLQQFGWAGVLLGAIGLAALVRTNWRRAALLATAYLVNALFAYSYNVGDAHVFYLPSHMMIALLAAPGAVLVAQALMAGWARLEPDPTRQGNRLRADRFISRGPGRLRADRIRGPPDLSRLPRAGPQRGSPAGCRAERADGRHRRALRDPAHGSELAGPERSVLLRQSPAARDRLRAHGRRPALRPGARPR